MYYQEEIETMPRADLEALQLERLRKSVAYAYERIPLYKQRFDEAGVDPYSIESLEDIKRFPFIVKQDMRDAYPFGLFAVPNSEVARIHASSGTTGQATVVGHTANDLKNWGDCFARGIYMVGGNSDSTIQVSYGYGLFTGGLGAHSGGEAAGCTVIPTSSGNTKRQIQMMRDLKTDILACTPSYALLIADTAIEMGYNPAEDFAISGVILGAEPASEGMREEIRQKLGVQYCDVYGLSEVMGPGVAMECSAAHGLHVAEDQFFFEIVNPDTLEPVPDGEWGELVITTLTRECCPLVRYRTRDVTRVIAEECPCGRTHRKIDRIVGRTDDMMIIRGVNVFPSQIEQVVTGFPELVTHYQIVLTTKGPLDRVELRVETAPDFPFDEIRALEDLKKRLAAELKSHYAYARMLPARALPHARRYPCDRGGVPVRSYAPQDRPHRWPHRRHDDHPRRERVPVPDRAGGYGLPRAGDPLPDRAHHQGPARSRGASRGNRARFPVRRDPCVGRPQEAPGRRTQEQPPDCRGDQVRGAYEHRAQRGQGKAYPRPAQPIGPAYARRGIEASAAPCAAAKACGVRHVIHLGIMEERRQP